jgi:hypothetical protein
MILVVFAGICVSVFVVVRLIVGLVRPKPSASLQHEVRQLRAEVDALKRQANDPQ